MRSLKSNPSFKPNYHFFPITGWINDPNGLIYWKGKYHMFYQYNPKSTSYTTQIHWGHAVSEDLVHWIHLPVALYPKEERNGVFSGSAVEDDGRMKLLYTLFRDPDYYDGKKEVQCLSESADGLNFQDFPQNPVISSPPENGFYAFRDPKVRRAGDNRWEMALGAGKDGTGRVLLYKSTNLINWHYEGVLFEYDQAKECECPDLINIGGKDLLIFSAYTADVLGTFYFMGKIREGMLKEERSGMLDWGNDYYAAQTFFGTKRTIVIAWMQNWLQSDFSPTQREGWNGMMSLPRELHVENGELKVKPVKELESLRISLPLSKKLSAGKNSFDLKTERNSFEIDLKTPESFYFKLFNTKGECVKITLDNDIFEINTKDSGITEGITKRLKLEEKAERNHLRIFVDSSSVEIFLNERYPFSFRIYPEYVYNMIELVGDGGAELSVYALKNIWL